MAITKVSASLVDLDGGVVINESSADADFRVESNDNANMLFVDGGNNRVGIGTGTPEYELEVKASTDSSINIRAGTSSGDFAGIYFGDTDYPAEGRITYQNSDNKMRFWSDRQHVMTLDDNARVGIGTESPSAPLHIQTNDSTTNTTVTSLMITNLSTGTTTTGFGGEIRFQAERNNGVNQNTGGIRSVAEVNSGSDISSGMAFDTSTAGVNSERMRISYNGAVGINRTASQANTKLEVGGADNVPIIAAEASGVFAGLGVANSGLGLYLGTTRRAMLNANGLHFGSSDTAAANALDDYEEGTWTPSLRAGSSALTISYANGPTARYTKIGRMVHVHLGFRLSSVSGTSGTVLRIYGLPYANISTGGYQEDRLSAFLAHNPTADHSGNIFGFVGNGTSYIEFRYLDGGDTVLPSNGLDSDTAMSVYGIYYTSS